MEPSASSTDACPVPPRALDQAPISQLTRGLISTYNRINQNYYNKRKLAQDGQALRKKKGTSSSKKTDADYELLAEEEIFNGRYKVNGKRLGMGSFGQVVEAHDMQTGQEVAIKIVKKKKNFTTQAQLEISILESLHRAEHAGKKYIVQLRDTFVHKGHQCIVFERLDSTLYDVLKRTMFKGVSLKLHANPTYRRDYFDEHVVGEGQVEFSLKVRKVRDSLLAATGQLGDGPTSLAEIVGAHTGGPGSIRRTREDHTPEDYRLFLDLLQRMLDYNPATRITPAEALLHPFVTSGRPVETVEKKKSKTMRSTQLRDAHDPSSSVFDPTESQRVKLRRLYENPGSGH
ncbi:hypothetical protein PybrP1_012601 [[Pythium] brassicae (nom. inval.)]|nr:hypothetical protein PybrP1_012601 [[Pythium] brassicae (nom. inval.)]